MSFEAQVIEDSVGITSGTRITTLQLRYPRFIHPEFMTHRAFSRSASSSRAVPVEKLIEDIVRDPAMPIHWGKNQPGMQARQEHDASISLLETVGWDYHQDEPQYLEVKVSAQEAWIDAMHSAIEYAQAFKDAGYHKQIVNRLLEPFAHINVVVTATEWSNFFNLRCHPDAQPEIQHLAILMREAMNASKPVERDHHLPYVTKEERLNIFGQDDFNLLASYSAARCARTSYLTHDRKPPQSEADLGLARKLQADVHMGPFEHAALADDGQYANFTNWVSARWQLEHTSSMFRVPNP